MRDTDTCEDFAKEFYQLQAPEEGELMPRFKDMPNDLPSPGPMPNKAVVLPRKTKCWIAAQITMAYQYPELADRIALELLSQQQTYYEGKLQEHNIRWPLISGVVGLLLGASVSFYIAIRR